MIINESLLSCYAHLLFVEIYIFIAQNQICPQNNIKARNICVVFWNLACVESYQRGLSRSRNLRNSPVPCYRNASRSTFIPENSNNHSMYACKLALFFCKNSFLVSYFTAVVPAFGFAKLLLNLEKWLVRMIDSVYSLFWNWKVLTAKFSINTFASIICIKQVFNFFEPF